MRNALIADLIFKGTHNSYECWGQTTPEMNHPPEVQMDDFGVWGLEIDYSIDEETGVPRVGHDEPGDSSPWGDSLRQYLERIKRARSLQYRPVFLYLEDKGKAGKWGLADPGAAAAKAALEAVFPGQWIDWDAPSNPFRSAPALQLAGRVVLYTPKITIEEVIANECINTLEVARQISSKQPQSNIVVRIDQYQANWTFDIGVPPNPIVVDAAARPPWTVEDSIGEDWECDNGDISHGEVVGEQGTFRFPYTTVGRAVNRAEGTTPDGFRDSRRAGYGWTVFIRPGVYQESLRIDIPLTLKNVGGDGAVVIVGQRGRMVRSLWITFLTNDENKDADTGLFVQVTAASGRILAKFQQARNKEYKVGFKHTEQLRLFEPVFEVEMTGAILTIDIKPKGNDTWRFDWELSGTWSDGVPFSDGQRSLDLDENRGHFERVLTV